MKNTEQRKMMHILFWTAEFVMKIAWVGFSFLQALIDLRKKLKNRKSKFKLPNNNNNNNNEDKK